VQISYVSNFCAERSATSLVRLVRSVSLARPQPCAPSSILHAVQHAATQERCASRRRSSVDGTARALRAAVGNGDSKRRAHACSECPRSLKHESHMDQRTVFNFPVPSVALRFYQGLRTHKNHVPSVALRFYQGLRTHKNHVPSVALRKIMLKLLHITIARFTSLKCRPLKGWGAFWACFWVCVSIVPFFPHIWSPPFA